MYLIPAIDMKGGRCVRLTQGAMDAETVYAADPVAVARRWEAEGAERLHLVDLDGAMAGAPVHADLIGQIIRTVRIPVQVGGGIRTLDTVHATLAAGARWVILGTSALAEPTLVVESCARFPGRIIVGIDSKGGQVATRGWTALHADRAVDLALKMETVGVAALILTDIEKDGMLAGPNVDLYRQIAGQVKTAIIASGGVATLAHIEALARVPGVQGTIIGKALYTGAISLRAARAHLATETGR